MKAALEEPRLTRFLRAFEEKPSNSTDVDLFYKVILLVEETNKLSHSWAALKQEIKSHYGNRARILEKMLKLERLINTNLKVGNSKKLHETALLLLRAYLIKRSSCQGYNRYFKEVYGESSLVTLQQMYQVLDDISQSMPAALREKLRSLESNRGHWGSEKEYSLPEIWVPPDTDFPEFDSPSIVDNFSMTYCPPPPPAKPLTHTAGSKQWLSAQIDKHFAEINYLGMTKQELQNSIIYILSKPHSTNDLQNELYNYFGYDKFDLVRDILLNRKTILKSNLKKILPAKEEATPQRVSVVVSTKEELDTEKKRRKEEKKRNKIIGKKGKCPGNSSSDEEDFNPAILRMKRIAELTENVNRWFMEERNEKETLNQGYPVL